MSFERLFDLVRDLRRVMVPALVAAAVWGGWSATGLALDMSFRPLFRDDPAGSAQTRAFEAAFGQGSGARIGALVVPAESRGPLGELDDGLVRDVGALAHVDEVLALPAADGHSLALWARLDLPLADLAARRPVIARFRELVRERAPPDSTVHFVGVSVVEDAYATIVLESLFASVGLSTLVILVLLLAVFGQLRTALAATAGLVIALPVTFGLMAALGQSLTIVNSMVATLVLVIGVADAIHMISAFRSRRAEGLSVQGAARAMVGDTGLACLMTTATTAAGFLSLQLASLPAIRDFGLAVALGVVAVYVANQVVLPNVLVLLPPAPASATTRLEGWLRRVRARVRGMVLAAPGRTALAVGLLFVLGVAGIPRLEARQRFNEEVAATHPIRVAQDYLEEHHGGVLGPELEVVRLDGAAPEPETVAALLAAVAGHAAVTHVDDLGVVGGRAGAAVRVRDVGTEQASELVGWIRATGADVLGPDYELEVVGPWWLAQQGMAELIRDMVVCFVGACLLVLPFLAVLVRNLRLFLIGVVPNVLPLVFVLGFMAWTGLTLRIGTSMILAIALGIAVDDTIHLVLHLRRERRRGKTPVEAVAATLDRTGHAVLLTSLILAAGFASMATSELLAIRDMGLVGSVAMVAALAADVLLAPALYLLSFRPGITSARALTRVTPSACRTRFDSRPSSESESSSSA